MNIKNRWNKLKKYIPLSIRGWFIYFLTMAAASVGCLLLQRISESDAHVPLIFVLVVLIVSLTTDGYFYGVLASLTSVITVNYAFTYPYAKMDFSIYGYPLTFMTMLAVSVAACTLTSRVREQERLKVETEREKVRANLLRAVSHDLRTPLTAISGSIAAVLESDDLPQGQSRELLTDAKDDAEWLCRMVENLLSVTRISGGETAQIHKEEEILEEVLSEAVVNFKKRNRGVSVSVSVPDELLFVPMDAMLIEQVLINLMDNAVIHGENTEKIAIVADADEEYVSIRVKDDGKGIEEKTYEHLFDGTLQFTGKGSADKTRGLGIGLSVCKTIIEAHGGRINAENTEQGSCFTFTLPYGGQKNEY